MRDTMRDLLSKLDGIISESELNPQDPKGDYQAKRKALQDLQMDPVAGDDPEISKAIAQRKADLEKEAKSKGITTEESGFQVGDDFGISFSEDLEIATEIVDILEDGIVIQLDDKAINYLANEGFTFEEGELVEGVAGPQSCWKGYRKVGTKPGTGKNAGKRVNDCEKIGEELDEYFFFDQPKGKDRGPRDNGTDELERRSKLGKNPLVKHSKEYKEKDKHGGYKIAGPKGKLPEDQMSEGKSYSSMPADVVRKMYGVYQDVSQGVEQHRDAEGAGRIYDALKNVAVEHGVQSELRSLMNSAANSAHMDFDTDPGDFKNWFPYAGELLGALKKIHDEKESEPDVELDDSIEMEAKYQGREVPLGKPMKGDVKKSKVYVKNAQGNVVKVNFGDKKMRIKKSNPNRRKSFRARHNCSNPGPRWKARYWSCRAW